MKSLQRVGTVFLSSVLGLLVQSPAAFPQTSPVAAEPAPQHRGTARDGRHDFDFSIGTWKTHISRLQKPLSGSTIWIKMEGTKTERKIWNGRAHLEEIEADGPTGHMEGLTLFLYNPQAHQWSQTFASSRDGTLGAPLIGAFNNGRGEFLGQDTF